MVHLRRWILESQPISVLCLQNSRFRLFFGYFALFTTTIANTTDTTHTKLQMSLEMKTQNGSNIPFMIFTKNVLSNTFKMLFCIKEMVRYWIWCWIGCWIWHRIGIETYLQALWGCFFASIVFLYMVDHTVPLPSPMCTNMSVNRIHHCKTPQK